MSQAVTYGNFCKVEIF